MIRKFQEIIRNGHGMAQLGEPEVVPPHPSWLLAAFSGRREPKWGSLTPAPLNHEVRGCLCKLAYVNRKDICRE